MKNAYRKQMVLPALAVVIAVFAGIQSFAANDLQPILSKMPASNTPEVHKLVEQILADAPASMAALCGMIAPEGQGDVKARYALNALLAYCSDQARGKERAMLEQSMLKALRESDNDEVKAFLVDQLRWIASDDSVALLAGLLSDANLCSPACRALTTLASADAENALIKALPNLPDTQQARILQALGQMRSRKAAKQVRSFAGSGNRNLRDSALFALANIAEDDDDKDYFENAIKNANSYEKAQFSAYYLIFAKRLAEQGDEDECLEICRDLLEAGGQINSSIPCGALTVLVDVKGADAFPLLVKAMKSKNEFMQGTAMRLAERFTADEYAAQWCDLLPALDAKAKIKVINLLGKMDADAVLPSLEKTLASPDLEVSQAALAAMIKCAPKHSIAGMLKQISSWKLNPQQKFKQYAEIAAYADQADEKAALIGELSKYSSIESLQLVSGYIDQADTSSSASLAAVSIAIPANGQPLKDPVVAEILSRAAQNIDSPAVRQKAMALVAEVKEMHGLDSVVPDKTDGTFTKLFNGKDLSGWKGLMKAPYDNPYKRAELDAAKRKQLQAAADKFMNEHWSVKNGVLVFDGGGTSLVTDKDYKDFEMFVDWKIRPRGDSGVYLRGFPQVQIWDPEQWKIGSGGLYNNKKNPSKPLVQADNPTGEWNTFYIKMVGDKVTVYLNDELVVDNVTLENYWKRGAPILPTGAIELQAHGNEVHFKDVYVREVHADKAELPQKEIDEGFKLLFNGYNLDGWIGNTKAHVPEGGILKYDPKLGGGHLLTEKQYDNFIFRFEFKLTPGANNGLGIRTPAQGDPAYVGMELQILDNTAPKYANLKPYQYHGSIYGIVPAELGRLRPVGEWNEQEVIVNGRDVKIILNGETIVDANLDEATKNGTMDGKKHPGLKRKTGHIAFCSHGSLVFFRNIRIKELD